MAHPQSTFKHTTFTGPSLLSRRRTTISKITIKTQLDQLRKTGRYDCFKLQWHPIYADKSMWPVPFHLFWDSDVAKWIEGACYFLRREYDAEIDNAIRELVEIVRGAQQEDGYLNVHYTVVEPEKRWSNIRDMHELYNAGHLIEAALAHSDYYKNELLLEPIVKYVSLIQKTFGPLDGQRHGYPGHPEIELALLRLYSVTRSLDVYELAKYFLTERGNPHGQNGMLYFDWEEKERGDSSWLRSDAYPQHHDHWYCQSHAPILKQKSVEGHAVRAMYLLTAVSDLVCLDTTNDQKLSKRDEWVMALERLWKNMVNKKMYVTGGIGAVKQWEGFGIDYFLPQGTDEGGCYAETCASIAVMMLAERLLQYDLDARYGDIMELCLYNNVMTSMSLDGKAFTYVNQLASSDKDKSVREEWFWCACCPPNLIRLFGSLGGYLWDYGGSQGEAYINVHLYTAAKVELEVDGKTVVLEQTSNWPWENSVHFQLLGAKSLNTTIRLRIPGWSKGKYELTPAPSPDNISLEKGYLILSISYTRANPKFSINIGNFDPRYIASHPYTNGRTLTLARGPIIYCVEDADNDWETNHFKDAGLKIGSPIHEEQQAVGDEEYVALKTECWQRTWEEGLDEIEEGPGMDPYVGCFSAKKDAVFIPYYLRANRGGRGHMRVGLLEVPVVL